MSRVVCGIAADRFAQRGDGVRRVLLQPIGVAQVEEQVRVGVIGLRCLAEIGGGICLARSWRTPQLNDADVVQNRRIRSRCVQPRERRKRRLILGKVEHRNGRKKLRLPRERMSGGNVADRSKRLLMLRQIGIGVPELDTAAVKGRLDPDGLAEKADL